MAYSAVEYSNFLLRVLYDSCNVIKRLPRTIKQTVDRIRFRQMRSDKERGASNVTFLRSD